MFDIAYEVQNRKLIILILSRECYEFLNLFKRFEKLWTNVIKKIVQKEFQTKVKLLVTNIMLSLFKKTKKLDFRKVDNTMQSYLLQIKLLLDENK